MSGYIKASAAEIGYLKCQYTDCPHQYGEGRCINTVHRVNCEYRPWIDKPRCVCDECERKRRESEIMACGDD